MNKIEIHINEPWWSAWKTFNWSDRAWGIGLKASDVDRALKEDAMLYVTVGNPVKYFFNFHPFIVKNFSDTHKTTYSAKGTKLYVVPNNLMEDKK